MKTRNRYIALGASILVVLAVMYFFSDIVAYVLIAWVLSMIGQPLMSFFRRNLKFGKFQAGPSLCAVLTMVCYLLFLSLIIVLFAPLILEQARNLANVDYQGIGKTLEVPLNQFNDYLYELGIVEKTAAPADQLLDSLKNYFQPSKIGEFFSSLIGLAGSILMGTFSVLFITFFFLREDGLFTSALSAFAPNESTANKAANAIEDSSKMLTRYFGGVLVQITAITIFISVALGIIGVKNALLIAFFAAIINVIPYVGPIIGATFAVLMTISSTIELQPDFYTETLPLILKVVAVFASMQMLDNFLLQPFIFSNSVKAHPLEIFIIILLGAKLNGVMGMILAIPAYTVIRVVAKIFLSEFRIVQQITGGIDEELEKGKSETA